MNGLPVSARDIKNDHFFTSIRKYQVSAMAIQETGVNEGRLGRWHSLAKRIRRAFDSSCTKWFHAYNKNDITGNRQLHGGTAILSTGDCSHYAIGSGADETNLGRWCWARFRGKDQINLRVVSAYRPVDNKTGPNSVWNQHRKYFNEVNDPRNPRAAFLEDFDAALTSWIATGDQVLVSGDFNDDISSRKIQNLFAKHGMHHMVFCRHNQADAPATCNKNTTTHKNVDGVWGTANLVPLKCGFLEAGDFPGDHVMIWMDIAYEDALGHNPPPVHRPEARRLKLDDVRVEKRYMTEYRKRIEKSNLSARQFALEDVIKLAKELTTAQAKEANDIDDKRFCAMMQANHRCRKLLMGAVHFSASTQLPRNEIAFWTYAIARRKHRLLKGKELDTDKYGSRKWARAKHAAKVTKVTKTMTIDDMQLELDEAFKRYNTAKKNHEDSRIAFIKTFPEEQQKRILRAEEQRRKGRICRRINQKLAGGSVTHVIVTDPDGSQRTCNDKDSIEAACLETHENKYRQTEDSPFMQDPLLRDFGYQDAYYHAEEILLGIYDIPDGVSIHTKRMIAEMKMPPEILEYDPCPDFVSDHSHTSAWRKAKERTSAGHFRSPLWDVQGPSKGP